jgi:hypothetical protein
LPVRISADVELGTQDVRVAILQSSSALPQESDWKPAVWDSDGETVLVLVGPDGGVIELVKGRWYVYVNIDAPPESPVIYAGPLTVV